MHRNGLALKKLSRERPHLARLVLTLAMRVPARFAPTLLMRVIDASLPEPDRAATARPRLRECWPRVIREAFRQGARGPQRDGALISSPWGLDPARIAVPVPSSPVADTQLRALLV